MTTFLLTGDIAHAGVIAVEAETVDEALDKAEAGEFVVHDETDSCLAFTWDGDGNAITEKEGD